MSNPNVKIVTPQDGGITQQGGKKQFFQGQIVYTSQLLTFQDK